MRNSELVTECFVAEESSMDSEAFMDGNAPKVSVGSFNPPSSGPDGTTVGVQCTYFLPSSGRTMAGRIAGR